MSSMRRTISHLLSSDNMSLKQKHTQLGYLRTIHILLHQKNWVDGWAQKMAGLADVQQCIYAVMVGGRGQKRSQNVLT